MKFATYNLFDASNDRHICIFRAPINSFLMHRRARKISRDFPEVAHLYVTDAATDERLYKFY